MKTTDFRATNLRATNLMVGDWVRIMQPKDFHGNERRLQVTEISEADDSICYFSGDAGGELTISTRHLESIPLTREILEMNGLSKLVTYGTEKWVCDKFILNEYDNKGVWRFCAYTNRNEDSVIYIRYVHELQHALRLCGIDKEIVL